MKRTGATVADEVNAGRPTKKAPPAGRCWLVTIFDMGWAGPQVQHPYFRYFLAQKEKAPETDRLHWQGYLELTAKARMAKVKEVLGCPTAHLEPRRGSQQEAMNYCRKTETRAEPEEKMEFGTPATVGRGRAGGAGTAGGGRRRDGDEPSCWTLALEEDKTYEEALEIIRRGDPRAFLLYGQQIKLNLMETKKPTKTFVPEYIGCPWLEPPELKRWREEELPKKERARCLVLVGPTRIGKTQWARHLFPTEHIYYRGLTNFRKWDDAAKLLILDDIPWEFIPQKKSILTQMGEAEVTDKYCPKKTIWVTMPAVVLTNDVPNFGPDAPYWEENTVVVHLEDPLFDPDWRLEMPPPEPAAQALVPPSPGLWDEDTVELSE